MIKLLGTLCLFSIGLPPGNGAICTPAAEFIMYDDRRADDCALLNELTQLMHPMTPALSTSSMDFFNL